MKPSEKTALIAKKSYELGAETMLRMIAEDTANAGVVHINKDFYREKFKSLTK